MVKNMNTKRYKDYVMEIRVTSDTCKKYNISGKSNDIARNLKQILHTSQLNRDECKDIMKWFEKIIREYAHTSCIFIPHAKEVHITENVVLIACITLTDANVIDIHRTNKHGEYIEIKRQKQREVVEIITKKRVEKAIGNILTNINKLKNSSIERNILLDKLNNSEVEITSTGASCIDENVIAIDDDILIELDNFLIHGKLERTEESSYSARIVLHTEYYSVIFKENHKKFITFDDLSRIFCNVEHYMYHCDIETLEKLDIDLVKKLNNIDCEERDTSDDK